MRQLFLLSSSESLRVYEEHSGWRLMTLHLEKVFFGRVDQLDLGAGISERKGAAPAAGCVLPCLIAHH